MKYFFTFLIIFCFGAHLTYAHGDEVTKQTKTVGNYIVEFEYNSTNPIFAGEPYDYDFYLLDRNTQETIPVDSISVVFTNKEGVVIVGANLKSNSVYSANGRITGVMPSPGDYKVSITFLKGEEKITNVLFDYKVLSDTKEKNNATPKNQSLLELIIPLVVGIAIGMAFKRLQKNNTK